MRFSQIFIGFHGFLWIFEISRISIRFHGFRGPRLSTTANVCKRDAGFEESFARSQLAATGCCFVDFHGFPVISCDFHRFSLLSLMFIDFRDFMEVIRFHGFRGPRLSTNGNVCKRNAALKENSTRFLLAAIPAIFESSIHRFIGSGG